MATARRVFPLVLAGLALVAAGLVAGDALADEALNARLETLLSEVAWPGAIRLPVGVTRHGTVIWCIADSDALDVRSSKPRRLLVAALDGSPDAVAVSSMAASAARRRGAVVAVIPVANPEGWAQGGTGENGAGGRPAAAFPPKGAAYSSLTEPEAACVWRFAGWFAPDQIIELHGVEAPGWQTFLKGGDATAEPGWPSGSLASQTRQSDVAGIGQIPAVRVPAYPALFDGDSRLPAGVSIDIVRRYSGDETLPWPVTEAVESAEFSPARREVLRRLERSSAEVVDQLTRHYGHGLATVMYQPALALVARLRYEAAGPGEDVGSPVRAEIEQIVRPYLAGEKPTLGDKPNGSQLSGHLVFAELGRLNGDPRCTALVRRAADLAFDESGGLREAMPFHNEMSDAVFMAGPILTSAGRLTGELRYYEASLQNLRFMRGHCRREDGLYRHSPLCEAPWGRGNGFPALGLALCLTDLDAALATEEAAGETPALDAAGRARVEAIRDEMLAAYREHLAALVPFQDPTGMWRQVIDFPGSYREFTATSMIGFAMQRGLRQGWLDEATYRPVVDRAWRGIKVRTSTEGVLLDVCTGTGKQPSLRHYLDREAILGRDERGGAMALMFAVELATASKERP